nr:peritrophin-1-like [Onthophagus taurus]
MFSRLHAMFIQTFINMKSTVFVFAILMVFLSSSFADPVGTCSSDMDSKEVDFLVDSEDCSVFYKCNWGEPVQYRCNEGLHFNKETGGCDWPEIAGCNGNDNENNTEEELSNEIESNEVESNETEPSENKCPNDQCPAENGAFPEIFSHPEDCDKFCKCDRGIAYDKSCPPGLHFNKELQVCDWPENAKCENDDSIDSGSGEPDSPEINDGVCSDEPCQEVNGKFPVFFAHPETCEKYCVCDWGKAYDMSCPTGLHFSLDDNVCVEPENARCK